MQFVEDVYALLVSIFFFNAMAGWSEPHPAWFAVIILNSVNFIRFSLIFNLCGLSIVHALVFFGANLFCHRKSTYQEGRVMTRRYPYSIPKQKRLADNSSKSFCLLAAQEYLLYSNIL